MSLFYDLGRRAGKKLAKAKWMLSAFTGSEEERAKAERQYGSLLAEEYVAEAPVDQTPEIESALSDIGNQLKRRIANNGVEFSIRGDTANTINAVALPGGFIFVSRPLLDLCSLNPDEVAFVVAHEMGHVVRGHASSRFVTSLIVDLVARNGVGGGVVRHAVRELLSTLVQRGYSRENEYEADEFAVKLSRAAGYDPAGGARLFGRMKDELSGSDGLGEYFSTHPSFDSRIARILRKS